MTDTPDSLTDPTQPVEADALPSEKSAELHDQPAAPEQPDRVESVQTLAEAIEPEPEPKKTRKRSKKPSTSHTAAKRLAEIDRVEAMDLRIEELTSKLESETEKRLQSEARIEQTKTQARAQWLSDQGLIRDEYSALAPSVEDADPLTEEGRRALSKFRSDNPTLFKGAPERPKAQPTYDVQVGQRPSIGQMFSKVFNL